MDRILNISDSSFRSLDKFTLFDLETVRLILRGGTVLDWNLLNLSENELESTLAAHMIDLNDSGIMSLVERIKDESISYLQEQFEFPIPKPVRNSSLPELLSIASEKSNRHRQLCACMLLKAMHVINHFDASEARQALKMTDQELFLMAEQLIYRTISQMMSDCLPVVEFIGGRKQRSSMVTKLLSKSDPLSAQLFDKMRFRIVTATKDDVLPTISHLSRKLFPFNYVLAGESYNTLFPFASYCQKNQHLNTLVDNLQLDAELEDRLQPMSNLHSSPKYKVVHWVADMPIRIPNYETAFRTDGINPVPRPIIYVRAEIQILDRRTHRGNEKGHASHHSYKTRQKEFVTNRLKVGLRKKHDSPA